ASLEQAQANLELAQVTWNRDRPMVEKGWVTQQQGTIDVQTVRVQQAAVGVAQANIVAREARGARCRVCRILAILLKTSGSPPALDFRSAGQHLFSLTVSDRAHVLIVAEWHSAAVARSGQHKN